MKKTLLWAAILTWFTVYRAGAFEITADTRIVTGSNAVESTLFAAREMADYIFKASGIKPVVAKNADSASTFIVINTLQNVKTLPVDIAEKLAAADTPDAFAIVCRENTLYIVGKDRVGELYGVYAFLSEKMGIRWFRAATQNDSYEYVPKTPRLRFDDFELVRIPAFRYRQLTHSGATGRTPVNGQTLAVRQGFQINPPWNYKRAFQEKFYLERCSMLSVGTGGHGGFYKPVSEKLFAKHPEYFALQNGKRVKGKQICISNLQVQNLVQEYIENIYKTVPPDHITYLFGMLDTTSGWCECASCRKLDGSGPFDYINVSTRFHKVAVKIMANIYKKYPDARLEAWAYHTYRTIPEGVKYDPRTLIYYCTHGRCYGHELNDPSCLRNVKQLELIKAWRKISSRMKVYEYANCTPVLYGCMEDILRKDLLLYRQLGLEGWKEEIQFADARFWPPVKKGEPDYRSDRANSNWQWYCVAGKLLWNPNADPEEILKDVESKYYGKSYPAMKKYHDFRRKLWNNSAYCFGYPTGDQRREQLLSVPGARAKLLALLKEAELLAGNDRILLNRLKDDRDWLLRYWIQPNKALKRKPDNSAYAPSRVGTVTIDGDPDDGEWLRAWYSGDFKYTAGNSKGKKVGKSLKTVLAILSDTHNLYFRVIANIPENCGDISSECITFFIMPPTAAKDRYYISVNSNGKVVEAKFPGNCENIVSAVKRGKGEYVMEVKIPLARLGNAERGAVWKLHAARYTVNNRHLSLDGTALHDANNYRSVVIGSPLLKNGSFENLNSKGTPENWNSKNCKIIKNGASNSIRLENGSFIYQFLTHPELNQQPIARKIKVSFRSSGKGTVNVYAVRYNDTKDAKAKHGYRRKFFSTQQFYKANLSGKQTLHSCEYTINPDEWIALRFTVSGKKGSFLILDDVAVSKQ
ncbi:MAG: DUF4838 domain-containing protein [Lentisphaeria bacterium]|nr:DUF4838 domain-containing protein [Lentisphaeria bacterium]